MIALLFLLSCPWQVEAERKKRANILESEGIWCGDPDITNMGGALMPLSLTECALFGMDDAASCGLALTNKCLLLFILF